MGQYCGTYPTRVLNIFVLNGGKVYINFLICQTLHSVLFLSSICHDIPIEFQLMSTAMKYLAKVGNSENKVLQLCYRFALSGSMCKISNTSHVFSLLKESKNL